MRGKSYLGFIILVVIFVVLLILVLGRGKADKKEFDEQMAVEKQLAYPEFNINTAENIYLSSVDNDVIHFRKDSGYWMVAQAGKHPGNQEDPAEEVPAELEEPLETEETPGEGTEGDEPSEAEEEPEKELKYYQADETLVADGLLAMISKMEKGVQHSKGQGDQAAKFGVDPESGIEVKVNDAGGNILAHFFVGQPDTAASNFIRFSDSDEIFNVPQAWRNFAARPFSTWRDKTMFDFSPGIMDTIRFTGKDEDDLVFVKNSEGVWENPNIDWFFDTPMIDTAVNRMSTLEAADWPREQLPKNVFELIYPWRNVIVEGGGESYELVIFEVGEGQPNLAGTGHDDSTFVISQADVDIILLNRDALEIDEPTEPEMSEALELVMGE